VKNSLYVLWLEGVSPAQCSQVPSFERLAAQGVDLHLVPLPLNEPQQCYYQVLTGMGAGKFGRFDAVCPDGYRVSEARGIPEGVPGRLLPDILRASRLGVISLGISSADELEQLVGQTWDFVLVRVRNAHALTSAALETLFQRFKALAAPASHLAVLTDVWSDAPHTYVNVNDFLADIGLLEVGAPRQRSAINWPETLTYGFGSGQLWINLRGREPQGVVSAGREYQEVCDALIRELQTNWLDPRTREPVVAQVLARETLYTGDYLFKAPDLTVVYRPGYAPSTKAFSLDLDGQSVIPVAPSRESSVEAPYARMIVAGPSLEPGQKLNARLIDIVPSTMYLLGQPVPYGVDGEVLLSLFTSAYRQQQGVELAADERDMLSSEEEGMIVERLRDLGYLG
jgi:hypothetical protein